MRKASWVIRVGKPEDAGGYRFVTSGVEILTRDPKEAFIFQHELEAKEEEAVLFAGGEAFDLNS